MPLALSWIINQVFHLRKDVLAMANDRRPDRNDESEPKSTGGSQNPEPQKKTRRLDPRKQRPNNYNRVQREVVSRVEKLETENLSSPRPKEEYPTDVLGLVASVTGQQPFADYVRIDVMMVSSTLFDYLAESTWRAVETLTMRPTSFFTQDQLLQTYRYLLAMRICQVANVPMSTRPAEVRYPAVLGPILASIGRFLHPTAAYELTPQIDPADPAWSGIVDARYEDKAGVRTLVYMRVIKPPFVDSVLATLYNLGMPLNTGLPAEVIATDDHLYRLDDVNGRLTGNGDFTPASSTVLNRALVSFGSLAELYGHHRVVYASIDVLRSAVDKLARDSFISSGRDTRRA
jgi:hypothetical protein